MELHELLSLIGITFYFIFASVYVAKSMGITEEDNAWFRLLLMLLSMTMGLFWFGGIIAEDVYKKLNNKETN